MRNPFTAGSACVFLLAVLACQSRELMGPEEPTSMTAVANVSVELTAINIPVGQRTQARAVARDADGNELVGRTAHWTASVPSVATITDDGGVTGVAAGTTQIVAAVDGVIGHHPITVDSVVSEIGQPVVPPTPGGTPARPPELPRASVNTEMPAVTGRTISVAASADLQAALDGAQPGDQLLLAPGATYIGNFVLPAKSGTAWIVVRTNGALPPEGVRFKPGQYQLPRIVTPNGQPAIQTATNGNRYRLVGLEVTTSLAFPGEQYGLVALTSRDLVVDRSYIHGTLTSRTRRGVALNCGNCAVIDSHIDDIHDKPDDSQAIAGWSGPGPFKIVNNYLAGAGENILFGGADPGTPGMIIADIEIRRNHIHKPDSWANKRWTVKNLIEFKHAYRVLIEGNVFDGNWADGQDGEWAVFVSINQNGTAPQSGVQDVTLRYNIIRNVGSGILMGNYHDIAAPFARYVEHDNLYYNTNQGIYLASWGAGVRWHIISGPAPDVQITRNTYLNDSPNGVNSVVSFGSGVSPRMVVKDNLGSAGVYGIGGLGQIGADAWALHAPDGVFAGNVLQMPIRADEMPVGNGNVYPLSIGELGFDTQYRSATYPGKGADITAVLAATSGVVQ